MPALAHPLKRRLLSARQAWALSLAVVLPRALLLALSYGARFDIDSYRMVEASVRLGQPLYDNPDLLGRYPYLPAWSLVLRGLGVIGRAWALPPWQLFKAPALLADAGIVLCLVRLGGTQAFATALAYALSPLAILIGAGHGQFDSVVLLFLLLALAAAEGEGKRRGLWTGMALGAAVSFKAWPLFLLPAFFRSLPRRQAWSALAAALALPLLLSVPWLLAEGPVAMASRLYYAGSDGISLPQAVGLFAKASFTPSAFQAFGWAWILASAAALLALWARAWRRPSSAGLRASLAALSLGLLAFAPALSSQYCLWPLPFVILWDRAWAWRLSAGIGLLLLYYYWLFFPEALNALWIGRDQAVPQAGAPLFLWAGANLAGWSLLACAWWRARQDAEPA